MVGWFGGQLFLVSSFVACFFAAMAFSCTDENIKNIQARETIDGFLSYSDEQRPRVVAEWLRKQQTFPIWD